MFSKVLIKLIDQAIVPAVVLLATRLVAMVLISSYYDIPFTIARGGFVFESDTDFVFINTYSLLIMLVVVGLGFGYILLKSFVFHETHITPSLTAKLFSLRLSSFIQTSFDVYSQGVVWLSYVYLLTLVIFLMSLFNFVHSWLFLVSALISLVGTIGFILDIEQEISFDGDEDEIMGSEEYVVRLREH